MRGSHHRAFLLLHLGIAAVAGLVSSLAFDSYLAVPEDAEWAPIVRYLRHVARSDDYVAFSPDWLRGSAIDRNRLGGLQVVPLARAIEGSGGHDLWVYCHRDDASEVVGERWPYSSTVRVGAEASIGHFSQRPVVPQDRASLHLEQAKLKVLDNAGRILKESSPGELSKEEPKWQRVRYGKAKFKGKATWALRLDPVPGKVRVLEFPGFVLSEQLLILAGLADRGGALAEEGVVALEVSIDGKPLMARSLSRKTGLESRRLRTPEDVSRVGTLAVKVVQEKAETRELWFDVYSKPEGDSLPD